MKTIEETIEFIKKRKEQHISYRYSCKMEMLGSLENDSERMHSEIYSETNLINHLEEILNFIQEENK